LPEGFDPRLEILASLMIVAVIAAGSGTEPRVFLFEFAAFTVLAAGRRIPARTLIRRAVWASPFILTAAALYPLSQPSVAPFTADLGLRTVVMAMKAFASVFVASLLVATYRPERLVDATRWLGLPEPLGAILALAVRFLMVLEEEAARMKRARDSRTLGRLGGHRLHVLGWAAGLIFIRGWRRARTIRAAMESRGFNGLLPVLNPPPPLRAGEAIMAAAIVASFAAVRILWT